MHPRFGADGGSFKHRDVHLEKYECSGAISRDAGNEREDLRGNVLATSIVASTQICARHKTRADIDGENRDFCPNAPVRRRGRHFFQRADGAARDSVAYFGVPSVSSKLRDKMSQIALPPILARRRQPRVRTSN